MPRPDDANVHESRLRRSFRQDLGDVHFPGCASRLRLPDPGPEAEGGHFDERGWYHPPCDCDQTDTARLLFDAKVKLVKIRDEPRFELLLPSEADAVIRALDAYAVLLLDKFGAGRGSDTEGLGARNTQPTSVLARWDHAKRLAERLAEARINTAFLVDALSQIAETARWYRKRRSAIR